MGTEILPNANANEAAAVKKICPMIEKLSEAVIIKLMNQPEST